MLLQCSLTLQNEDGKKQDEATTTTESVLIMILVHSLRHTKLEPDLILGHNFLKK
jgi:hypothetical protein